MMMRGTKLSRCATLLGALMAMLAQPALSQFELMDLPYDDDALEPYVSSETISYHYGKHHAAYVNNLNAIIEEDSSLVGRSLWWFLKKTDGTTFNNAAQIYNHNLYWNSLSPTGGGEPSGDLYDAIVDAFGSYDNFETAFTSAASGHFGSGWAWLVMDRDGAVTVYDTHDATNPVSEDLGFPLLVCDVWEHAYYIDYRNGRSDYIEGWWSLVNWDYASEEYERVMKKYGN
eukprot:jgi/Undpi1/14267/HiC_scaffold_9.g03916.m1